MKIKILFCLTFLVKTSYGVIYHLNDSMYGRMPPIFHFDDYNSCVSETDGMYCTVEFDLISDTSNDLLDFIRDYSEDKIRHFNHTHLRYGVCVTQNCKRFMKRNTTDLRLVLERCLNETLWDNHNLKTKVTERYDCFTKNRIMNIDIVDIIIAILVIMILMINIIGCLYGICTSYNNEKGKIILLQRFCIQRNFSKLISCDFSQDKRVKHLKGFFGLRTLLMISVISIHALLPNYNLSDDVHAIEQSYDNFFYLCLYNGMMAVQVFFMITGCLLAFDLQRQSEKHSLNWKIIPKGLFLRWLRLTPSYAVVLASKITWLRFYGYGPFWKVFIGDEIDSCRKTFWENLLYYNNYSQDGRCMTETWYIATDMQLNLIGLTAIILLKGNQARMIALALLFIFGITAPAAHTYFQDLNGAVLMTPENGRLMFLSNPTVNIIHKQFQNHLAAFVIGLCMGLAAYKLLTDNFDFRQFKKYSFVYPFLLLVCTGIGFISMIFYVDEPITSIYIRTAYAAFVKPLFCIVFGMFILAMVFKCDNTYRIILEWKWWLPLSRVSYCAYLIHMTVIRLNSGTEHSLLKFTVLYSLGISIKTLLISYSLAAILWILVEAPIQSLIKDLFHASTNKQHEEQTQK